MNGHVRHVVSCIDGAGLVAQVRSERYFDACAVPVYQHSSPHFAAVAEMNLSTNRRREDSDWFGVGVGLFWTEMQCSEAVEDLERLILPHLEGMHTAADLWNWHRHLPVEGDRSVPEQDGRETVPSVGDWVAAREWLFKGTGKPGQYRNPFHLAPSMYAARCLPDQQLLPMLDDWLKAFHPEGPLYTPRAKQLAELLRAMPQTPLDAPL